jgi:hypothetical protein
LVRREGIDGEVLEARCGNGRDEEVFASGSAQWKRAKSYEKTQLSVSVRQEAIGIKALTRILEEIHEIAATK